MLQGEGLLGLLGVRESLSEGVPFWNDVGGKGGYAKNTGLGGQSQIYLTYDLGEGTYSEDELFLSVKWERKHMLSFKWAYASFKRREF